MNPAIATVRMKAGPRLTVNEIQDASGEKNSCIIAVNRLEGLAQYKGAFPIHIDYPISQDEFNQNKKLRWPTSSDETITTPPHWPQPDEETVVRKDIKSQAELDAEIQKQLKGAIAAAESPDKQPEL